MPTARSLPLLRAPPFPWQRAAVAQVDIAADIPPDLAPIAPDRVAALFAAIRQARVGGAFWLPAWHGGPVPQAIVATSCPQAAGMLLDALAARGEREVVATADAALPRGRRCHRLPPCDPWSLLELGATIHADAGHELAALAIIAGLTPVIHGTGRFASAPAVAHDLLAATRYRDPFFGGETAIEAAIDTLADWRRTIDANRDLVAAAGIARWKRQVVRRFLWAPGRARLTFAPPRRALRLSARAGAAVLAWPSRVPPMLAPDAAKAGVPIAWIEDGFLRSVGLGSALHPPFSIVVDRRGIYYDATAPSDLEHLLQTTAFVPDLLARAARLRETIVTQRVSKYGAADASAALPERVAGRRLVLVAGQVIDDLSILRGSGGGPTDPEALLAAVRRIEPDAEIWYRPHPDVDAGFRRGRIDDAVALRHADRVVRGGSMAGLLDLVDAVHVMTSLTGFEALLRGRDVTVHGMPFYAGWGLTRDLAAVPARRSRRLTLDELVAATLLLYPRYLDPVTLLPCPAEVLTARLSGQIRPRHGILTTIRAWQGSMTRLGRRMIA